MKIIILPLMFIFVAMTSIVNADTGSMIVSLYSEKYEIIQDINGYKIDMEGFSQLMDPGKPLLPMKRFQIMLPPGARAVSVDVLGFSSNELSENYDIQPFVGVLPLLESPYLEEEVTKLREEWEDNHKATYLSDKQYPSQIAWLLGAGTLRKYSYASVAFCPIAYHPISKRLTYYDRVDVNINYTLPAVESTEAKHIEQLLSDCVADKKAQKLFLNYNELVDKYTSNTEKLCKDTYNYVIITTRSMLSSITESNFLAWKAELGYTLKTVLITNPEIANQQGSDVEEKIRNFLREYYGVWGIEYVLFVGDYATVPMRICYPDSSFHVYDPSDPNLFAPGTPTDHYYADLSYPDSLSWDLDGDGFLGEYSQDLPDFLPEVYVGRIPVNDTDRITYTLNKSVTFEQDTGSWKKNVLHPTSIFFFENQNFSGYPFIDGASVIDSIEIGLMDGWNITHLSEQYGLVKSLFDWEAVSEGAFLDYWRNGQYAVVNWSGHGWSNSVSRSVWEWDNGDGVPEHENGEMYNLSLINHASSANLDDDYPSVVFAISCNVGYPEPNDWGNLGIDLATRIGYGAAVGMVSASRPSAISVDWRNSPGGAEQIAFDFNRYLITEEVSVGVAVYDGKYDATTVYGWSHIYEYGDLYNINLYGDPSLKVAGFDTAIESNIPLETTLFQNYPNPFNPVTTINFSTAVEGNVSLIVHNSMGAIVAKLVDGKMGRGYHSVPFDGSRLVSGVYYYTLKFNNQVFTHKMMILK